MRRTNVLVTGARGFVGRNVAARLRPRDDIELWEYHRDSSDADLASWARNAHCVIHTAGVNRAVDPRALWDGNTGLTARLCELLTKADRPPRVLFTSSVQASSDSDYGRSKHEAESVLHRYARGTGADVRIYRLKNLFGKWSRPDYNSVVATFCHHVARDQPIDVRDPDHELELVYIDEAVDALIAGVDAPELPIIGRVVPDDMPSSRISLGELASRIRFFRAMQGSLRLPDFGDPLNRQLYATYLSHVRPMDFAYDLPRHADSRGDLAEVLKSPSFGQVFVSRTRPGVTRGNHYHHTKTEKFLVVAGRGLIRFRAIDGRDIIEFDVSGEDYRVLDIPPGYTHSITNVGSGDMITFFWASEIFEPEQPDTYSLSIEPDGEGES